MHREIGNIGKKDETAKEVKDMISEKELDETEISILYL